MAGLVGITLLQLYMILQRGSRAVVTFCQDFGLIAEKYRCPVCKNYAKLCVNRGRSGKQTTWRCSMAACGQEVSVRIGTVFEKSKLSIDTVLKLLYFWSSRRSVEDTATELTISKKTVSEWFKFCRDVCSEKMEVSREIYVWMFYKIHIYIIFSTRNPSINTC